MSTEIAKQEFERYWESTTISEWPVSSPIKGRWKEVSLDQTLMFYDVPTEITWAKSKLIDIHMTGAFVERVETTVLDLTLNSLIEKSRLPMTIKAFNSSIQLTKSSFTFILKSSLSSLSKLHIKRSFESDSTLIHHLWLSAK